MSEWNLLDVVSGFLLSRCSVVVRNSIFYTIIIYILFSSNLFGYWPLYHVIFLRYVLRCMNEWEREIKMLALIV